LLKVGTEVRGYRIEGILGHGGMGVVYEARQISLDRLVALKVLSPELSADVSFRERFRREGQIQAAIDHPHIVTVHEAGEIDEGLFIAMRIVRGPTLKDMIIGRELEAARTLRILTPIADALDAAHSGGLIHRDVKPQNILVGARDHAFLADFGLTKGANESGLTRTGQFVGTIDYISPEQIRGEQAQPASDIYALAAVLYECLTGVVPYAKPSDAAVLFAHMSDPRPLVTEKRPDLPPALNDVIVRGMDLSPAVRHASAGELMADAERAFGRRIRAALTPPGPIELPEEAGIREPENKVPTRETRIRQAAELADAAGTAEETRARAVPAAAPPAPADATAVRPAATRPSEPVVAPEPEAVPGPEAVPELVPDPEPVPDPVPEPVAEVKPEEAPAAPPVVAAAAAGADTAQRAAPQPVTAETEVADVPPPDHDGTTLEQPRRGAEPEAPRRRGRSPLLPIALGAAVVAIVVGFLVGHGSGGTTSDPAPLSGSVASADVGLRYPTSWHRATTPKAIDGLSFTRPVALESTDKPGTGLVAGLIDGGGSTLLPASFLGTLPSAPKTDDPVRLGDLPAYRYRDLRPKGAGGPVTVFTVPTSAGVAAVACYRPTGTDGSDCERIAGSLRLEQGKGGTLGPDPAYGDGVRAAMDKLGSTRSTLRQRLAGAKTVGGQQSSAADLATAYRTAATSLSGLTVGPREAAANAAIVSALRKAAQAYADLGSAAGDQRRSAYATAQTAVASAEAAVQRALQGLEPLGYTVS